MSQVFSSHGLAPREMESVAERVRRLASLGGCKKIPRSKLRGYGPGKCKW